MSNALEELQGKVILHLTPTLSDIIRYLSPASEPGCHQTPAQISKHQQELIMILPIVLHYQRSRFLRSKALSLTCVLGMCQAV